MSIVDEMAEALKAVVEIYGDDFSGMLSNRIHRLISRYETGERYGKNAVVIKGYPVDKTSGTPGKYQLPDEWSADTATVVIIPEVTDHVDANKKAGE